MLGRGGIAAGAALVAAVLGAAVLPASPALAAERPTGRTTATGHDVSYPQCGRDLPTRGDIAVVGVNGGTGTSTNPCLAEQLAWGDAVTATGALLHADVYVNTANPGHLGDWWPASDRTRDGGAVTTPYGTCSGAEDRACAYVYGYSIADDDLERRGVADPASRTWWLDVETMNSWSWNRPANLAVLDGMAAAVRAAGARVGVYSTPRQWALIAGAGDAPSLAGAPSWIAGAVSRSGAVGNCGADPLTPGGGVRMVQWVEDGRDHDVACEPGVTGTRPVLTGDPEAGGRLVADLGAWGPSAVAIEVVWTRDGTPIAGAAGTTYQPTSADVGASIAATAVGRAAGAPDLRLRSPAVRIAGGAVGKDAAALLQP